MKGVGDKNFTEELRNLTGIYRRDVAFEVYRPPGKIMFSDKISNLCFISEILSPDLPPLDVLRVMFRYDTNTTDDMLKQLTAELVDEMMVKIREEADNILLVGGVIQTTTSTTTTTTTTTTVHEQIIMYQNLIETKLADNNFLHASCVYNMTAELQVAREFMLAFMELGSSMVPEGAEVTTNNTSSIDDQMPDMSGLLATYEWLKDNETCTNETRQEMLVEMYGGSNSTSNATSEETVAAGDNSTTNATEGGRKKRNVDIVKDGIKSYLKNSGLVEIFIDEYQNNPQRFKRSIFIKDGSVYVKKMIVPTLKKINPGVQPKSGLISKAKSCSSCGDPSKFVRKIFKTNEPWDPNYWDPETSAFLEFKKSMEEKVKQRFWIL